MLHFSDMAVGEISLIANQSHDTLIVIVETSEQANAYTTSSELGAANIFDNIHAKWNEILDTQGTNVAVLSYDNSFVRDNAPETVLARIEKDVKKLSVKMEIDPKDVGIIICSNEITRSCFKNGHDFINVLVANASDKRPAKAFPLRLPFDSKFAWTNSVPAWLWTSAGGVKDEASGVNLLGFVIRAGAVVSYRETEGSIYHRMRQYHTGKYGELKLVQTLKQFDLMMRDWRKKKFVSFDTECDNLNRVNGNTLLAIQAATVNIQADTPKMWVLPMEHSETPWTAKQLKYIKRELKYYFEFECKNQTHVYQNQKYDVHQFMAQLKVRWYAAKVYDVMAGAFSLEENQKIMKDKMQVKPYSLDHIERTFEYERPADLVIKKADRDKMASFSMRQIADYGIIDVLTPIFIMFEQIEIARNRGYPNFFRFITRQLGPMVYAMTEMEHNGIAIDLNYLKSIASPIGPLAERIRQTAKELAEMPSAQKANKQLLKDAAFQENGLFGKAVEPQLWSIRNKKHLQTLFFDILGLQPLNYLKDETGKLDKYFQKIYRYTVEVAKFTNYNKLTKLKSAFADSILKFMLNDPDMRHDVRLRPVFGYLFVLSGRSCFTANTPIYVLDEREQVAIKDIKQGDWVWSVNEKTGQPEPKRVLTSWKVGKRHLVKITIQMRGWKGIPAQQKVITCTPNHLFMLANGNWIEAQDLKPHHRLYALERTINDWGYRKLRSTGTSSDNNLTEHKYVYSLTGKSAEHVHHINEAKTDNRPSNLKESTASAHARLHSANNPMMAFGNKNLHYKKMSKKKLSAALKEGKTSYAASRILKVNRSLVLKRARDFGIDIREYNEKSKKTDYEITKERYLEIVHKYGSLGKREVFRQVSKYISQTDISVIDRLNALYNVHVEHAYEFSEEKLAEIGIHLDSMKTKSMNGLATKFNCSRDKISTHFFGNPNRQLYNLNDGRYTEAMIEKAKTFQSLTNACAYLGMSKRNARKVLQANHTVVSVKHLNGLDYVYDIEVEDNNNFFANGVCAHNSTTRPSSQQLPQHGKDAKIIKSQFRVRKGKIILKSDYAGHEVRVSGNLSLDTAICGAVDEVNLRLLMFRRASDPVEVEKLRELLTDLHVQNYKVFFDIDIGKKDPRRQDAKTAVFAVTYGSKEKAIGEKMRTETLYSLEDKLVSERTTMSAKDIKKLEKQIAYMKSETAVQDYLKKASDLLEVLRERWGVLTRHITKQQRIAARNNVVFGPHGRPRHLWGYLHFDRFVHYAMDRRVFNSQGQGYASDYGYLGIYLAKKAYWDLFISRGLDVDVMQTNAVHDSSFNELEFKYLPLAVYMQEHAMLTLTQEYYGKHFGITNKTQYGADMEIGMTDADMMTWDGRTEGLIKVIEKYGPESGLTPEEIADVIHDAKILGNLRFHELHQKNPYVMTLRKQEVWDNVVPRLRMFRDHFKKTKTSNVVAFPTKKKTKATVVSSKVKSNKLKRVA